MSQSKNNLVTPQYSIDQFCEFIFSNKGGSKDPVIFVPNNKFKTELIDFISEYRKCSIIPCIISIDSLCHEKYNLVALIDCITDIEILDETNARFVINNFFSDEKSYVSRIMLDKINELNLENRKEIDLQTKKFLNFLQKHNFHLKSQANNLVISRMNGSADIDIFFFKSSDTDITAQLLLEKLRNNVNIHIFNEPHEPKVKNSELIINKRIETNFEEFNTLIKSNIFDNDSKFISNDYQLIETLKLSQLNKEYIEILNDNIEVFKLINFLLEYKNTGSPSHLLNILKLKIFNFPLNDICQLENDIRLNNFLDISTTKIDLIVQIDSLNYSKLNFNDLLLKSNEFIEKYSSKNLYLESAINELEKITKFIGKLKPNHNHVKQLLAQSMQKVKTELINQFSPLKTLLHVNETRYVNLDNSVLINFNSSFFQKNESEKRDNISLSTILLNRLKNSKNISSIEVNCYEGDISNSYDKNVFFKQHEKFTYKTKQENKGSSSAPKITLNSSYINPLTPTSIKVLLNNPYLFYLVYILKIKAENEIDNELDSQNFGIIIHKCLELSNLKEFDENFIENFIETFKNIVTQKYKFNGNINKYKIEVIANNLAKSLKKYSLQKVHKELQGTINLNNNQIKATADLILESNHTITLIDYKTGKIPTNNEIKSGSEPQLAIEKLILKQGGFFENIHNKEIKIDIIKTSTSSKQISSFDIDEKIAEDGLVSLQKYFFTGQSTFFAPLILENSFLEKQFYGILRKREWI